MLPGTADNLLDKPDEELVNLPWKPWYYIMWC